MYGDGTVAMIEEVFAGGAECAVALLRHSARTFEPGLHDLQNQLTDEGRALCRRFGQALPKELTLRGYASPAERCLETAQLILEARRHGGGDVTRHRPVEALGVFYVLDQMKMWRGMEQAGGSTAYLQNWFDGQAPADVMMPPGLAARLVLQVMVEKGALSRGARGGTPRTNSLSRGARGGTPRMSSLSGGAQEGTPRTKPEAAAGRPQLDLCVSHDMTLYLLRDQLLGEPVDGPAVEFLDGLIAWRERGSLWLKSLQGPPRQMSAHS